MSYQDQIAVCTVCPWMGTSTDWYDGFEVCPHCLSEARWEDGIEDPDQEPDELLPDDLEYDLFGGSDAHQRSREWLRQYSQRERERGRGSPAAGIPSAGGSTVTASKARQGLLKGALSALEGVGRALRSTASPAAQEEGQRLMLAAGRVCLSRRELAYDPCSHSRYRPFSGPLILKRGHPIG